MYHRLEAWCRKMLLYFHPTRFATFSFCFWFFTGHEFYRHWSRFWFVTLHDCNQRQSYSLERQPIPRPKLNSSFFYANSWPDRKKRKVWKCRQRADIHNVSRPPKVVVRGWVSWTTNDNAFHYLHDVSTRSEQCFGDMGGRNVKPRTS